MVTIEKFIEVIKNIPSEEKLNDEERWLNFLDKNIFGWRDLIKDPKNWEYIKTNEEYTEKLESYHAECFIRSLIKVAGIDLICYLFDSDVNDYRKAARYELESLSRNLTPTIWQKLTPEVKEYIINYLLGESPREPYNTLLKSLEYVRLREYINTVIIPFLPFIYIPSAEILNLISVIKRAGDKKYLDVVESRIKEIKAGSSSSPTFRVPKVITPDEHELIARVFEKFKRNGFIFSPLPEIILSLEPPPLFVAYPELEREQRNNDNNFDRQDQRIPRNRDRIRPETISIEEVLGLYFPDKIQIILYQRGLEWFTKRFNLDIDLLTAIVLIHEIGHWITHLLPKEGIPEWQRELYKLTSTEVHEGWAQLITYWIVKEIGGDVETVFNELNRRQAYDYHIYEKFKDKPIDTMIKSLEYLRLLKWPASLKNWENSIR